MSDTELLFTCTTPALTFAVHTDRVEATPQDAAAEIIPRWDITDVKVRGTTLRISTPQGSYEYDLGPQTGAASDAIYAMPPAPPPPAPPVVQTAPPRPAPSKRAAPEPPPTTGFWWVNQGLYYARESAEGVVRTDRREGLNHHGNITRLGRGDVLFHYVNRHIVAVGQVREPAVAIGGDDGTAMYQASVTYQSLTPPIDMDDIPLDWRAARYGGPFNKNGKANQGYLYPLPEAFVTDMRTRYPQIETALTA